VVAEVVEGFGERAADAARAPVTRIVLPVIIIAVASLWLGR
jgi:hypothetical protein